MKIQRLDVRDDLIVALRDLPAGSSVGMGAESWTLRECIPMKQKFAARDVAEGELVRMYGVTVGRALRRIQGGELINQGNLTHASDGYAGKQRTLAWAPPPVERWRGGSFRGFKRASGRSGTANYWVVIPLVFCENRNLTVMREALTRALGYHRNESYETYAAGLMAAWRAGGDLDAVQMPSTASASPQFPNVDGVKFLEHGLGCGGTYQDARALCRVLAGYIDHPNVAGATVLSLGCQHAQVSLLMEELHARRPGFGKPLHVFEQQKSKSERDMLGDAMKATLRGVAQANELVREDCPLTDLVVGMECGGSDGFSGLSANPALGHVSDVLSAIGATPVLSEFPELCGVEQSLCDRCTTPELAERFVRLMRAYEAAAEACGSGFDSNPSPGNIRDGLITDAIKSAGAAKKGGNGPITEVCDYGERIQSRGGLVLYCTPGNDVESTTALVAGGCNVLIFTTGLGTPTGNPICPTIKVSTNTGLAQRMADIIDFDTGPIITGERSVAQMGEELMDLTVRVASGEVVPKAVSLAQDDFLPWKRGVSL